MNKTLPSEGAGPSQPRVRVGSPSEILAVVPHLMGFHPANSFVVIGAGRSSPRIDMTFRYDLPDPPDKAHAADIAEHAVAVLARRKLRTVIGIGYGPGRLVTPVADEFAATLRKHRLHLRDLLRVEDGRYWSYVCDEPRCCPPEGVAFDAETHPVAAAMTQAGRPAYPDRAALASTLAPVIGRGAVAMEQATQRAEERAGAMLASAMEKGRHRAMRQLAEAGRRAVGEAISIYRKGGSITEDDRVAWLSVMLAQLEVRDDAWSRMDPLYCAAHLRLWTDVVRRARPHFLPAPACLLAFTCWQSGDGALANVAIERALTANPDYSMGLLLRDVMDAGVPPSAAALPMTPEEVKASYERDEADPEELGRPSAIPRRRSTRKRPSR